MMQIATTSSNLQELIPELYSGLMSATFTIGRHVSVSAFRKSASTMGDCRSGGEISWPSSAWQVNADSGARALRLKARTAVGRAMS